LSRRRKEAGPMPAASAGLLMFYGEETKGPKVRPEVIVASAILLIILCIVAPMLFG